MSDIKVPPFTDGQKELIKMTERLANGRKICDVDDVDDDKDIKEILSETIAKIEMKKKTNFARITSSPEALAEWLSNTFDFCDRGCSRCIIGIECCVEERPNGKDTEDLVLEWLKQESK